MRPRSKAILRRLRSPDFLIGAALFLFALYLRLHGIGGSLPYVAHPDEPKVIDSAIHIVKSGDLNPHLYIWPSFYIYLQALLLRAHVLFGTLRGYYAGAASLPDVTHIFTRDAGIYIWARTLAAVVGAATIPVLYTVGKELFNNSRRVGVAAAMMLAVSPLHVQYSRFALTDAPLGLMGLLVLWASYRLSRTATRGTGGTGGTGGKLLRDSLVWAAALCGLLVGVATATKYNGLYLALVPLIALVVAWRRNRFSHPPRSHLVASLAAIPLFAALGFVLCEPYVLLDWPAFSQGFAFQVRAYLPADSLGQMMTSLQTQISDLGASDMHFFGPAFLGALIVLANPPVRNRAWLLIPFPIFYLLAMSRFSLTYVRNLIVTLPFLALLAGYVIDLAAMQVVSVVRGWGPIVGRPRLHEASAFVRRPVWGALRWVAVALGIALVVAEPFRISRNYSDAMADPDSRNLAWSWMQGKMAQGYRFAAELHPWQVEAWPDVLAFDVENPEAPQDLTARPPDWYAHYGYDYVALNSNLTDKQRDPAALAQYRALPLVESFAGDKEGGKGPTITVLALHAGATRPAGAPMQAKLGARLEDFANLEGVDLLPTKSSDLFVEPGAQADARAGQPYHAGQAVGLNLYLRALRDGKATDRDWQVWLHLVDPISGGTVAQLDVPPLTGQVKQYPGLTREPHPVKDWHKGELLAGVYNFSLPANLKPGQYQLQLGMWVPPNGPNAQVSIGDTPANPPDYIVLGEVQVR